MRQEEKKNGNFDASQGIPRWKNGIPITED